jgi:hypothetical protein
VSPRPGINPAAPEIGVAPLIACGAGVSGVIEVYLRHPGPRPAMVALTVIGLDRSWVGEPVVVGPMQPGEITRVQLPVQPEPGAMGARYPFVVAAESTDLTGYGSPVMSTAESTLAVDSRERVVLSVEPEQLTAIFGRRVRVQITNPSPQDRSITLLATAPKGIDLRLRSDPIDVPPGRTVTVRGRVRVRRPRVFGTVQAHAFALAARGQGAPVVVEGTVRARPLLRGSLVKSVAVVLVVAVWAALGIIAIPRIAALFTSSASTSETATGTAGAGAQPSGSAGATAGAADGAGAGGAGGGGAGGGGAGGAGAGGAGAAGTGAGGGLALRGTVTGPQPGQVAVILVPTSLNEASAAGAEPAPGTDEATASGLRAAGSAFGKIPSWAVRLASAKVPPSVSTETGDDGSFSLAGIQAHGLYLLTFARAGFQTQRFIVNADTLAGADPMKVELKAGQGSLSGSVVSAAGPIGAATVAITDGRVALQTSTVSDAATGTPGSWNVTGLSTPGTYLVQASSPGFGTASSLVTLDAGGTATADLTLVTGVAAITGQVSGLDQLGRLGGLGGISVAVTGRSGDVTTTRTATTVTSGPVGRFTLPDLPTPGDYTLTVSGPGYQQQVQDVSLAAGAGAVDLNISLTRADGVISGTVFGDPATDTKPDEGGLIGAGLTLTGPTAGFKTMSTSDPAGSFRFTGVPPGTYVLAASMFGRVSTTVTVELAAAGEVTSDLRLLSNADTELPANGRISGRAVDARTSGPLTCDRVPAPAQDCVLTATIDIPVADPITGRIVAGAPVREATTTSTAAQNFEYTLPALDDPINPGLVPGLYTVRLSAPGYEPATTDVRVAQGQIAAAEPTVMQPLGLISGILTYRTGTPATPTCIVVVPAGSADPTSCVPDPGGTTCTADGGPGQFCSLVAADGTYSVVGLTHGSYLLSVLPTDPEFQRPPAFAIQLPLGSDFRYDPVINRFGRLTVTVDTPDPITGDLKPLPNATVTAVNAAGDTVATATSGTFGDALLTGLDGTYVIRAVDPNTQPSPVAEKSGVQLGLNSDEQLTLVPVTDVGPFVGRVTVVVDGVESPVPNAKVAISRAIIGFDGAAPQFGSVEVSTDENGCYAVVPAGFVPGSVDLRSPDCPTPVVPGVPPRPETIKPILDPSNHPASLVARPVVIKVSGPLIQDFDPVGTVAVKGAAADPVKTLDKITVTAAPVPIGAVTLTSKSPFDDETKTPPVTDTPDFAQANVTVVDPVPNDIVVSADASGRLHWRDPTTISGDLIVPGRYELTAQMPTRSGWAPAAGVLLCEFNKPCRFVNSPTGAADGSFQLVRLPLLNGTVSGLPPNVAADFTRLTVTTTPPSSLIFTGANTSPSTGTISFKDPALDASAAGFARPGTYVLTVALPGYASQQVSVSCGQTYLDHQGEAGWQNGCQLFDVSLTRFADFVGSVTLSPPTAPGSAVPLDRSVISVTVTAGPPNIRVSIAADGTLTWVDPTQPPGLIVPGNYTLRFHRAGFADKDVPFNCAADARTCGTGAVTMDMLPRAGGSVRIGVVPFNPIGSTVTLVTKPDLANVQVTLATTDVSSVLALQWSDPTQPFKGIVPSGNYSIRVHIPGYADTTSPEFNCPVAGTCGPNLTMQAIPSFNGQVALSPPRAPGSAVNLDPSLVNVTVVGDTSGIKVTVGATGTLTWTAPGQPAGLVVPGPPYQLRFARAGFADSLVSFTCTAGANSCGPGTVQLLMLPRAGGTVRLATPPATLNGATATLTTKPGEATNVQISLVQNPAGSQNIDLQWSDSSQPFKGIVPPGFYQVVIHIPGYADLTPAQFECVVGSTCGPGDLTPTANPRFAGTLTLNPPSPTSIPQIRVVTPGAGTVTVSYDAGTLHWQEPGAPEDSITPGIYTVSVTLAGYTSITNQSFNCQTGSTTCTLTLAMSRPTTLTVNLAATSGAAPSGARVRLTVGSTLISEQVATATSVAFTGLSPTQTYTVTVQAGGFRTTTAAPGNTNAACPIGAAGLTLVAGPNSCTVSVQPIGRVPVISQGALPAGFELLASTSITAVKLPATGTTPGANPDTFTLLTNGGAGPGVGEGVLVGTNDHEGLNSGRWLITATHSAYNNTVGVMTIDPTTFAPAVESGAPTTPNGPGLSVTNGRLAIVLAPTPVTPQVQLVTAAGAPILPAATVTLAGGALAQSCTVGSADPSACSSGAPGALSVDGNGKGLTATDVPPGLYQVAVTSGTGQFSQVAQPLLVSPVDPDPGVALTLAANWSTQSGTVLDGTGAAQGGAQVSLHAVADPATPAMDVDQHPLQVSTGDDGRFTFEKVPDGIYTVVTTKDGWAPVSGPTITISAAKNPMPADITVTVTARDSRTVVVSLDSPARTADGRPVDFSGAQLSLKPVAGSQPSGTPENAPLTGLTASATPSGFAVTVNQVPTGSWTLSVDALSGAAFLPFDGQPFAVPAPDPADPSIPVQVHQSVDLTPVSITVGWAAGCGGAAGGAPATGSLPIKLTRHDTADPATINATVSTAADGSGSAVVTVFLPSGDYDWSAQPGAAGWTGGTGSFSVPAASSAPVGSTGTILAPTVPVTVSLAVNGAAVSGRAVAAIPPGGGDPIVGQTGTPFCVPPGDGWTFSVNDPKPAAGTPLLIPDQTGVNVITQGPNTVQFTGFGLRPALQLATVAGRPADQASRAVELALARDGDDVWTGAATLPAGASSAQGPALIVGSGTYTLTGTPPDGDAFGVGTVTGIDPAAASAPVLTLPYTAVMLTVTALAGGAPRGGATVTLTSDTGAGPVSQTSNNAGVAVFRDLPAGTYTVTAQSNLAGATVRGAVSAELAAGPGAVIVPLG